MSQRPHEGSAEDVLSSSLLGVVHDPAQVEHLRAVISGFCHRCRNSLNGIKLSLYLFRRQAREAVPDSLGELEAIYQQVEDLFDRLQMIYRPMPIALLRSPVDDLICHHVQKWRPGFESRGMALRIDAPDSPVLGDFDPTHLGLGLDALARWRAQAGRPGAPACVAWGLRGDSIEVRWNEAAPREAGPAQRQGARYGRREAGASASPVDALALPLLARVVAMHGGCLRREDGDGFGVLLRWPQFRRGERDCVA